MSVLNYMEALPTPMANPARAVGASSLPKRNNSVRTPWTGERVDFLIALWAEGFGATCPQIAARLNELPGGLITDDAVIGKIARLGLPHKDWSIRQAQRIDSQFPKSDARQKRKHVRTDRIVIRRKKSQPMPVSHDNVIPLRVPFALIDKHQCHYVVGEVDELIYCGRARAAGSRWCEGHRERCAR